MKMNIPVSSLLHDKSPEVWTVTPEATVFDAITVMAAHNIGALLVMVDGSLAGIFTERDYTRKIALHGKNSKDTKVGEVISDVVLAVSPENSVEECMRLMTHHRVRHLPVIENDRLVGIVSIGDLVNFTISAQESAIAQMEQYIAGGLAA
jgi:CBS domain-containing protein